MENILVYNDSFFEVSQTFVYHQIAGLSKHFRVDLISHTFKNPHGFKIDQFDKYTINKPSNLFGRAVSKVYRLLTKSTLHLDLHSHLLTRRLLKKKNYRAIHAHFGNNGLDILHYAKKYNIPLVVTFHGYDASSMLRHKTYREQLPELFEYASAINLVSRHMIKSLEAEPWMEKISIIPCAVDPSEFNSNGERQSSDKIRIVHAGRIAEKKGVPDVVKVFANLTKKHNNLELHIAGDGEELDECKKLAIQHNLSDQIKFYGAVTHSKLREILKSGDIFVLNSRVAEDGDMEGTPVTLLEAMCLGKAVVSTYHAGIPDVVNHGINGLLAEERNNVHLENCIDNFIKNKSLREMLGDEAERTILNSYTINHMQNKIDSLFYNITGNSLETEVFNTSSSPKLAHDRIG